MAATKSGKQKRPRPQDRVYELKITLAGSKPPIWRRFLVTGDTNLTELHRIIQLAFGWTEAHLHAFYINGIEYSDPVHGLDEMGAGIKNQATTNLRLLGLRTGAKFRYVYDFGDDWVHDILVESEGSRDEELTYPRCTAGRRAGPPEDCGGIWRYTGLLQALKENDPEARQELLEWFPDGYDPEAFSAEAVNRYIGKV